MRRLPHAVHASRSGCSQRMPHTVDVRSACLTHWMCAALASRTGCRQCIPHALDVRSACLMQWMCAEHASCTGCRQRMPHAVDVCSACLMQWMCAEHASHSGCGQGMPCAAANQHHTTGMRSCCHSTTPWRRMATAPHRSHAPSQAASVVQSRQAPIQSKAALIQTRQHVPKRGAAPEHPTCCTRLAVRSTSAWLSSNFLFHAASDSRMRAAILACASAAAACSCASLPPAAFRRACTQG